jgi:hypothetical protein
MTASRLTLICPRPYTVATMKRLTSLVLGLISLVLTGLPGASAV